MYSLVPPRLHLKVVVGLAIIFLLFLVVHPVPLVPLRPPLIAVTFLLSSPVSSVPVLVLALPLFLLFSVVVGLTSKIHGNDMYEG